MSSTFNITLTASSTAQKKMHDIVDQIVACATSEGWTLVESRLPAGHVEWSILKKPSSLFYTNTKEWHVGFGVTSTQPTTFMEGIYTFTNSMNHLCGIIFENWDVNSKMMSGAYPASRQNFGANNVFTNSFTSNVSASLLPGSQGNCHVVNMTYESGFRDNTATIPNMRVEVSGGVKKTSIAIIIANSSNTSITSGGGGTGVGMFFVSEFDSVLSDQDDSMPLCIGRLNTVYARAGGTADDAAKDKPPEIITLTSGNLVSGTLRHCNHAAHLLRESIQYFSICPPFDEFLQGNAISRIPFFAVTTVYEDPNSVNGITNNNRLSIRGLLKGIYFASSISGPANWIYNGNSYSGTFLGNIINETSLVVTTPRLQPIILED